MTQKLSASVFPPVFTFESGTSGRKHYIISKFEQSTFANKIQFRLKIFLSFGGHWKNPSSRKSTKDSETAFACQHLVLKFYNHLYGLGTEKE